MTPWENLKRRKIVQWALAYLAGAWLLLDVTSLLGGHLGWPTWLYRALIVLTIVGFPVTLVLAWYHGERGRQRVSGLELMIVAGLLAVAVGGVQMVRPPAGVDVGPEVDQATGTAALRLNERSVAVLPLADLGPSEGSDFFAEAVTEEITSALSHVPGLTVTSRNSASKYDASGMTVAEFAHALGVSHVIEGSVQRSGDRVRVTVQLIDAPSDSHLWSESYERELTNLFDVQVEIAQQVAERLAATFTDRERERILSGATDNPVAYDLFLRAGASALDPDERVELLRRAVARDAGFWPAWEALGEEYRQRDLRGQAAAADSARRAYDQALEYVDDPSARLRIEAIRALAFGGDDEQAVARLRAAAENRPSDLVVIESLARLLQVQGRLTETVRWRRQAILLDPLSPSQWLDLWFPYYWMGLYERGERALRRGLELAPGTSLPQWLLAYHYLAQGDYEAGLAAADSLAALGGGAATRALALWFAGDAGTASMAFPDEPSGLDAIPPVLIPGAALHFAAGDSVAGQRLLRRARAQLEGRALENYLPEERIWPLLQLAVLTGTPDEATARLREYVATGGRDWRWIERSPLFNEVREDPTFRQELDDLRDLVEQMRLETERALGEDRTEVP